MQADNRARVYLREEDEWINVNITGSDKPQLPDDIIHKWQRIINTTAKIFNVPAGLIMKITPESMQVFLTSQTENNPYPPDGSDTLGHGLYCETVIGRNRVLEVEDSLESSDWKDNPDVKLNMISYLGFPVSWPDGEAFGTICVLDSRERKYSSDYIELLNDFKQLLEADLEREMRQRDLFEAENLAALRMREVHHRIKNQFNIISSIVQLKSGESNREVRSVLDEIDGKIQSVALLHGKIYKSINFSASIIEYIEDVVRAALSIYKTNIELQTDFSVELDYKPKEMFEFGIVFSELVSNSIKAGLSSEKGVINISTRFDDESSKYIIRYRDNGPGFPDAILKGYGKKGIGTLIVESFVSRFNGTVKRYNDDGAVVELVISKAKNV